MVYTSDDIKHLELMNSLEKLPKKAAPEPQSKALSFDENILALCETLRASGQDKYASNLERKFLMYKSANKQDAVLAKQAANVHMYRAHDEDGEDVINFAHPDGDKEMGEASNHYADVETIVSQHKKIVDVMNKTPTGKLASYVKQCKIALGQEALEEATTGQEDVDKARSIAQDAMDKAIKNAETLLTRLEPDVLDTHFYLTQTLRSALETFKYNYSSMKAALDKHTDMTTLESAKHVLDQTTETLSRVTFSPNANENLRQKSTYISWFNYLITRIWAAKETLRGNHDAALYHLNHAPSDLIANAFRAYSLKIVSDIQSPLLSKLHEIENTIEKTKDPKIIDNLTAKLNAIRAIETGLQQQKNEYDAMSSKLASLRKVIPVADVMKLPEWQSAHFSRGESVSTMDGLYNMLKKDHDAMINAFMRSWQGK